MKLYHRTDQNAADILANGFQDRESRYDTPFHHRGVWLFDVPPDEGEVPGDTLIEVDVPEDVVAEHEWEEEGRPYREFVVPADKVNEFPRTDRTQNVLLNPACASKHLAK